MRLRKISAVILTAAVFFCATLVHADYKQVLSLTLFADGLMASELTEDYILTVPADFAINTNGWNSIGKITVNPSPEGKVFSTAKKVVVNAESANSFNMTDGTNTISYTLKTKESDTEAVTSFTFAAEDINTAGGASQDIGVYITWESSQAAGDYTDTITYTAAVEDALLSLTVGGVTFYYVQGETWAQAIANHSTQNSGWAVDGTTGFVQYNGDTLLKDSYQVKGTDTVDSSATYDMGGA